MQAHPSLHPSEQTLQAFGNGQLDATSAEAVSDTSRRMRGVLAQGRRYFLRRLPRRLPPSPLNARGTAPSEPGRDQPAHRGQSPRLARGDRSHRPRVSPELANHPDYEIRRELGEAAWAWSTWPTTD